jgi:hypothetical protein
MKALILMMFIEVTARVFGAAVVVPNGTESVEGNSGVIPLFGNDVGRTQMVFGSQHFSLFPPEGVYLVELRFRLDGGRTGFSGSADLELRMSTSASDPEALNNLFSANVGSDETVVLPRTVISLSGTQTSPNGPNSFTVVIPLPNQFLYKPASGNLLIDAAVFGSSNLRNLDWSSSDSDGASTAHGGSPTGQTAAVLDHVAPVLQLIYIPVPEPNAFGLVAIGSLIAFGWRKRVTN